MLLSIALILAAASAGSTLAAGGGTEARAVPSFAGDSVRADDQVREAVLRNAGDVRRCYEVEGLRRNPALTGTIEIALTILPTGRVDSVAVAAVEMRGAAGTREVARCVVMVARNWRFERGPYAVETVAVPFRLTPGVRTSESARRVASN